MPKLLISGLGCCLLDRIYDHVDFRSGAFCTYMSRTPGDGGLEPGKLTFEEELEQFAGEPFTSQILPRLVGNRKPEKENIGGPCIVALINASQLAWRESTVSFYGCRGDDDVAADLLQRLSQTSVDLTHYRTQQGSETPSTSVLSDPDYDNGNGERTFVNVIGASWHYQPAEVDDSFYDSDICVFGGTALVPRIHQSLSAMLERAKQRGAITIVNTVYDSLSEKRTPGQRWPMGDGDRAYPFIDLLLVDHEEALRLSGCADIPSSIAFFRERGAHAVLVTNGARDVTLWADSPLFGAVQEQSLPVSAAVGKMLKEGRRGDSTGCGDNFAGGVIGSLARQMYERRTATNATPQLDLLDATRWGIVSGGFACLYYGGTYLESHQGEKLSHLQDLYDQYLHQK